MARNDAEIKEIVTEVEQGFDGLRKKVDEYEDQLYKHDAYVHGLTANMDPKITTRIPVPSEVPDHAAWQTAGLLNQSWSFHVEGRPSSGDRSPIQRRLDKQELFFAHTWAVKLDPGGKVSNRTHRLQAASAFAPWWLEWEAFKLPTEEDKREGYRKSYWPFKLSVLDVKSVAFMADDDGVPTTAVRYFELPYLEIAKRYGEKGKDDNPLTILNEQFGWLRGGAGVSEGDGDTWRKRAKVTVVNTGSYELHCIDMGKEQGGYREIGKEYPNPFGRVPLFIVTGRYNADAHKLEDRYMPLTKTLLGSQRTLDVLDSNIASISMTPGKPTQSLPESVARAAQDEGKMAEASMGDSGVISLFGDLGEIKLELDPNVKELRATRQTDRDMALPSPYLTNPDQSLIKGATAAGQLNAGESANRSYDEARESEMSAIKDVCGAIKCFIVEGHLNKKGQPEKAREALHIYPTGSEPSKKYAKPYKGQELEIGPEDFEDGDVLEITPVASSQSQKQLAYELKSLQQKEGYATHDDVLETLTEDVSGKAEELEAEARYQQYASLIDRADLVAAVELIRMEGGVDLSMLLMPMMGEEPPGPPTPQGDSGGMGTTTTVPPPTSTPDLSVVG